MDDIYDAFILKEIRKQNELLAELLKKIDCIEKELKNEKQI